MQEAALRVEQAREPEVPWRQGFDILCDETLKKTAPVRPGDRDDSAGCEFRQEGGLGVGVGHGPNVRAPVPKRQYSRAPDFVSWRLGPYRKPTMAAPRFPILFIAPSRIGDAVLASGLIRTLIDEVPGARFTFVASELTAPLFGETPGLERVIVMEKQPAGAHWFELWRQVRGRSWGLVVDLRGSALASLLRPSAGRCAGTGARRRATAGPQGDRGGRTVETGRRAPGARFSTPASTSRTGREALTAGTGPILALAPAAHWIGKTWPPERFAMVARTLLGPEGPLAGGRLMLVGGPEDVAAAAAVKAAVPKSRRIDLVGRGDPLTVYACLKRARLFIGADLGADAHGRSGRSADAGTLRPIG